LRRLQDDFDTVRVQIQDYVWGQNKYWSARWLLHGEAVLGVDLSRAEYVVVDEDRRTATLALPAPHLIASKVDHERSEELYARRNRLVPFLPGLTGLRSEVWKHADHKVQDLAQEDQYTETAKMHAERVLDKLFGGLQWTVAYQCRAASL
jgi:hypothetical protein